MKTIKSITLAFFACVLSSNGQVTVKSFATVNTPAVEALLPELDDNYEAPATDPGSVNSISFASRFDFPVGTSSVTINSINLDVDWVINGVSGNQFNDLSMNSSSFSNESGTSSPAAYARDGSGSLITMYGFLQNNTIANARTLFITRHSLNLGVPYPFMKMVRSGDMWKMTRSVTLTWVVSGIPTTQTFTTESKVVVAPASVTSSIDTGTDVSINIVGVNPATEGSNWWMETSTDLGTSDPWVMTASGSVSTNTNGSVTVNLTKNPAEPRRFWRVKTVTP